MLRWLGILFLGLTLGSFAGPAWAQQVTPPPAPVAREKQWPDASTIAQLIRRVANEVSSWSLAADVQITRRQALASKLGPQAADYLQVYGLQWMASARWRQLTGSGPGASMEIWGFRDATGAFAAFSGQRTKAAAVEKMGAAAFWTTRSLTICYHSLLIKFTVLESAAKWQDLLRALASELLLRLPALPPRPLFAALVPRGRFAPQTIVLRLPSDDRQWPLLTARAVEDELAGELAVWRTDSPAAAAALFDRQSKQLARDGSLSPFPDLGQRAMLVQFNSGKWGLLMLQDEYVCSLLETSSIEFAEGILRLVGMRIRTLHGTAAAERMPAGNGE